MAQLMTLNMGCGHNKMPGWLNVDAFPECNPDVVCDLENLPWPWPNDSVEQCGERIPDRDRCEEGKTMVNPLLVRIGCSAGQGRALRPC